MNEMNASTAFNWINYLNKKNIFLSFSASDKREAITKLVDLFADDELTSDKQNYLASVFEREELGSTGLGEAVAMPHGKCAAVKKLSVAVARLSAPLDFDSVDKAPVKYIFMIASPVKSDTLYIKLMASIIRSVKTHKICDKMDQAKSIDEAYDVLTKI